MSIEDYRPSENEETPKELWNYERFVVEYNKVAQQKGGFLYIPDEDINGLSADYSESQYKNIASFAWSQFMQEQRVDDVDDKYKGHKLPENDLF